MKDLTYSIHTLGCKVNSYESGVMSESCEKCGFRRVPFGEKADIVIVNTCAVTAESGRKSMQFLRRAAKENPGAVIVAAGCYAQIASPEQMSCADIVLGSAGKARVGERIEEFLADRQKRYLVEDLTAKRPYEPMSAVRNEHTRAFVKVEDGCDNFCAYCIIPYARGRVRSKPLPDAVEEMTALVRSGYKEIVLTGIHLDSWGRDIGGDLCDLAEAVASIPGLERLRFGSLEPVFLTEEHVQRLAACRAVCPQFHLSLQSGCDRTLRRMNRHYTAEEFFAAACRLRKAFGDDVALTTDVIVGFPGETEDDHRASMDFVRSVGFANIHVFPFSPREGTRAFSLPEQVPNEVKIRRAAEMDQVKKDALEAFHRRFVGRTEEILSETSCPQDGLFRITGHTRSFVPVTALSELPSSGDELLKVRITASDPSGCTGKICPSETGEQG